MHDAPLLRLLAVIQRELGADDARVEIGGRDPTAPEAVWVRLPDARRIVVWFDQAPSDRGDMGTRLQALVDAFLSTVATPDVGSARTRRGVTRGLLQAELGWLADQAGARAAMVIDSSSPVLWGCSRAGHEAYGDVEDLVELDGVCTGVRAAGLDAKALLSSGAEAARSAVVAASGDVSLAERAARAAARTSGDDAGVWSDRLLLARAVADVRSGAVAGKTRLSRSEREVGYVARLFGATYWIIVVYAEGFSDLRAEGALARRLPRVERLVLALPPFDPPRGGGKVMRMPGKPKR